MVALLLYVPWGGGRSFWFPDEPDVAEPTIGMLASGDWLVPRRNGEPWLDYPPLTYWLGAASGRLLGGPHPFALRLPIALIAVLLVGLTTRIVERLSGRGTALWSGLVLATAPQFVYQATNFHPDMSFALFVATGVGSYAWGCERLSGWRSWAWKIAGFGCLGGAVMAKGPLGLLLPGLILAVWHLSFRQWRSLLWLGPLSLVSVAVALPWYAAVAEASTGSFVLRELYLQNLARFSDGTRGHEQPWFYYLQGIWFETAPWSVFLPGAILMALQRRWRQPLARLAVIWFLVSLLFLTVATTKRAVYLLPAYPAVAFLIGTHLEDLMRERRIRGSRWLTIALGALAVLVGVLLPAISLFGGSLLHSLPDLEREVGFMKTALWPLLALGAGLVAGGIALVHWGREGVTPSWLVATAALLCFVYTVSLAGVAPYLDREKSYHEAAVWLRERSGSERIGHYLPGSENKGPGFRVEDPAFMRTEPLSTPREAAAYLAGGRRLVVLAADRSDELAAAVSGWVALPSRELQIGDHRFLAVGPAGSGAAR